jgi:hypothetical protein
VRLILTGAVLAALASPALAQSVEVRIGQTPADRAEEYGARDIEHLLARLDAQAEAALVRSGRYPGARMELVIEGAVPNRPTFEQLADRPGLSMESIGIGGAEISGDTLLADGPRIPVAYRWFETSIANVGAAATWSDADRAFRRFAQRLG